MSMYDAAWVAGYFDEYGDQEWQRLVRTPTDEVRLFVHAHYLREFLRAGDRVLEAGAGAGRFTQQLSELGASVYVGDISQGQLHLNERHARELGFEHAVENRRQLDICDLGFLEPETFDAVVCYGGPLSYVLERRSTAMDEMLRVLKPGGHLLLSVMSLWGSIHEHLPAILTIPADQNQAVVASGDLTADTVEFNKHHCHLFRSEELLAFLGLFDVDVVAVSASNSLSAVWKDQLLEQRNDPEKWAQVCEFELAACRTAGCLDTGTHLIAVVRKKATKSSRDDTQA